VHGTVMADFPSIWRIFGHWEKVPFSTEQLEAIIAELRAEIAQLQARLANEVVYLPAQGTHFIALNAERSAALIAGGEGHIVEKK
jgi:hypothetical protein